ncbi:collagen binding domain-containing protein, partial [Enterococcus faecalis]
MNKFFKCSLSLLIILIGGFYSKQLVFGEELKGTDIVDILEINDTNLSQGQMTSVKVTFNEKHKNHIKPGDTLTLLIPPGLEGMTENDGSPRKIFLGNLGEVLIYKDKVIATFNDSVKILDHVHGSFSFGIKSALTNNTKDTTIETNFGTNLQKQSITVQGVSDNQEVDTPPFFYKSGDLLGDSDKVRWFLNANLNKEELSDDIVISDTHGAGQILNKDSFSITVNNYLGSNSYDLNDFIKKGFGTIQFTTYNTFVIRLNKEHARLASFSIMYTTTITLEGQKQDVFENSYELNYHLRDKNPVSENNSTNVKNVFADGDADGDIDKDDTNDSVDPLP